MIKVFIDGSEGTTGLRIHDRLKARKDVELISISEKLRKDLSARAERINNSDITFLCLPDAAAVEAVAAVVNPAVKVIDASTAHRTAEGWVYGFPELDGSFRTAIQKGKRVAVPGCHASGFAAIVYPLVKLGIIGKDYPITAFSLTGYSGGGKKMIAEYENYDRSELFDSPRQYGLTQAHKHLPEMQKVTGLDIAPIFCPIVADYYSGMEVTVPIVSKLIGGLTAKDIHAELSNYYAGQKLVKVMSFGGADEGTNNFLPSNLMSGDDGMRIFVGGNDDRIIVSAVFDNLGKGASGAAIQCMNIMCGIDEAEGLSIK